jgi:hypothetical protein
LGERDSEEEGDGEVDGIRREIRMGRKMETRRDILR